MSAFQKWVIVLLLANLAATFYFGLRPPASQTQSFSSAASASAELPNVVSGVIRDRWFNQFRTAFNQEDYESIYTMFSAAAQARIDKSEMIAELQRLKKAFYAIEPEGAYSHSEFARTLGNAQVYTLFYQVVFSERSEFGSRGTLKITIAVQGDRLQILGIRLISG